MRDEHTHAELLCSMLIGLLFAYELGQVSQAWRWLYALPIIPAMAIGVGFALLPPSPRLLRLRSFSHPGSHSKDQALDALRRYRSKANAVQLEIELSEIDRVLLPTLSLCPDGPGLWSAGQQPTPRSVRCWSNLTAMCEHQHVLVVGLGVVLLQQLTVLPAVMYHSVWLLEDMGLNDNAALIAAAVCALRLGD